MLAKVARTNRLEGISPSKEFDIRPPRWKSDELDGCALKLLAFYVNPKLPLQPFVSGVLHDFPQVKLASLAVKDYERFSLLCRRV